MTAQPADPAVRGRFIRYLGALLAAFVLPAPFVVSYSIAVRDNVTPGAEASAVAVAAVVIAWLAAYLWVATRDSSRSDIVGGQWPLAVVAVVPFGVLVWMMLDLLDRGSIIGVWAALPIVTTVAYSVVLGASGRRIRQTPSTETREPDDPPPSAPAHTDDPVDREIEGTPEQPEQPEEPEEAKSPPSGITAEPEQEPEPEPSLAVGVDESFWAELTRSLSSAIGEQGGVALTTSVDGAPVVVGVVLPKQMEATSVRCEFSVLDVERVRDALDAMGDGDAEQVGMTWLHTHPGLGVFLSGTDIATSANWRNLDPGFTPIVVDVFKSTLADQIGVFGPDNRKMSPIGLVSDAISSVFACQIRQAVLDRYDREHLEAPEVIVGSAFSDMAGGRSGESARK